MHARDLASARAQTQEAELRAQVAEQQAKRLEARVADLEASFSRALMEEDLCDGGARRPNPAEAIVRNLMRAFPNAVFALVCPELPAAAGELGFVVLHALDDGSSEGQVHLLEWSSKKATRVIKSTVGCEAVAQTCGRRGCDQAS